jgi:hypothetical protein
MGRMNILERIHTERTMPTAVKMAFAGGNALPVSSKYERADLRQVHELRHTWVTSPSVSENAGRTFTVGSSHLVHLSFRCRDRLSS